jgi:single-strand DNA-binding protein
MSGSVNKVILVGNMVADPDIRRTSSGDKIANLRIATSERWKDREGNQKEKAEYHRVVIFDDRLADVAEKYLKKGSKVYVEGQLQTRKWSGNDGQEKYTTEVVLSKFRGALTMLDGNRGDPAGHEADDSDVPM